MNDNPADEPRISSRGPYARSAETRSRIVAAAWAVFSEVGYTKASVSEIAARAEISGAQLFYYFSSKEDLLNIVLEERDSVAADLRTIEEAPVQDIPEALLMLAARNTDIPGNVRIHTILAVESIAEGHPAHQHFQERYRQLRESFLAAFGSMATAGYLAPDISAEYAAQSTLALWDGLHTQWLVEPRAADVAASLRQHLCSLVDARCSRLLGLQR
ncbi:TetR/AcrR family transcriptional regulator [Microbacterium sp. NPDC058062]|uniref:TetR/AcrR family transcriptional regulator n=1 Tax=Microbacterium sp. NPDC058062 TaxID=3346320 RepID=UPI0036DB8089